MGQAAPNALKDKYEESGARLAANPDMDLPTMRDIFEGLHTLAAEPTDVTYEHVDAGGVPAIRAVPVGAATDKVIVYSHGGGCVVNTAHSHRKLAAHLAKAAGVPVVVPDYRLAPEHPFPAQIDDLLTVHRWLRAQGIAPEHTANAGDSAGGNLAVATAIKLRELGEPLPAAIVGFSPWVDMEHLGESMRTNADSDVLISYEIVGMMATLYLGETPPTEPLANPLHADLSGLPPMYVTAGDAEALLDNAERLVERVGEAGGDATLELQEGQQHVYQFMAGRSTEADTSIANAGSFLRERLGA